MECNAGNDAGDSIGSQSPDLDRNPSPPPDNTTEEAHEDGDAIGDTVYSKHWLFGTLNRLIQMVTKHSEEAGPMELSDNDEDDLCRVWDMAMDKDVAGFLLEYRATDILLGVIAKSQCPRLTEISVGILGNMACFPGTCLALSQNDDLGAVVLLLLGDRDPPTLWETCRLLLACVSQQEVCSLWLERMHREPSVCPNLCFIMSSSTNTFWKSCDSDSVLTVPVPQNLQFPLHSLHVLFAWSKAGIGTVDEIESDELLKKVGELVDNVFDLDEDLMRSWVVPQPGPETEDEDQCVDVASSLLEAANQLRSESSAGLETYLHIFQLLSTIAEGIQIYSAADGPGKAIWDFVCEVVCEDLCQTDDLPVVLQEQKGILVQAFAVLQALYKCQDQWSSKGDASLRLIGTILRVLEFHTEYKSSSGDEDAKNQQLKTLAEITAEFLADLSPQISKATMVELIKEGYLTEKTCLAAAETLHTSFASSFEHLSSMLLEVNPGLADKLKIQFPV